MDAQCGLAAKAWASSASLACWKFYTQLLASLCKGADVCLLAILFLNLKEKCKVINIYWALECQVQTLWSGGEKANTLLASELLFGDRLFAPWLVSTLLNGSNAKTPWKLAFMCSKTQNGEKHRSFVYNPAKSIGWTLWLIIAGSLNYNTFRYISKVDVGFVHCCWVPNQVMLPFKFHMNFGWKGHKCIPNILSNMKCEPNFNSFWQLNSPKIVGYIFKAACFDLVMRFMFF